MAGRRGRRIAPVGRLCAYSERNLPTAPSLVHAPACRRLALDVDGLGDQFRGLPLFAQPGVQHYVVDVIAVAVPAAQEALASKADPFQCGL